MGCVHKLFGEKNLKVQDLKVKLMAIDRDRRRKQLELRKLDAKKGQAIETMKKARKSGNNLEVDYLWEELSQLKVDSGYVGREAKIINRQGILLKRVIRVMERRERDNDRDGVRKVIERVRTSGLDELLMRQEVEDQAYLDEINVVLGDLGLESREQDIEEEDPEKARFLASLDEINAAEDSGDLDVAVAKEDELKSSLQDTPAAEAETEPGEAQG